MKYICTKDDDGVEEVFTFPRTVNHDAMADAVRFINNPHNRVKRRPISAGLVGEDNVCYGKSVSLDLESRAEDTDLLDIQFNG